MGRLFACGAWHRRRDSGIIARIEIAAGESNDNLGSRRYVDIYAWIIYEVHIVDAPLAHTTIVFVLSLLTVLDDSTLPLNHQS
ncbi:hypothetical protein MJO28_003905 [Puccinia striiformis f. sp. tritici]|uniref:Uncharacterized protein n=1 Tax=Puccinia striiformis f. sp. tritici TaxID=168172 RepID=A0ACC0ENM0_9BASI|nr:hypothetical protein MJO28_003905 [Puccinia striiformis f. sp. tritici]